MKSHSNSLEPLESRIAPAMVSLQIVNPKLATFDDVDGDHVTVKTSTGTLTAALFTGVAGAHGDQLQLLDLSAGGFDGTSITFTVKEVTGGDGLVNVGYINSTGHDLGAVAVAGDLGQIDAGSNAAKTPAVKSLKVASLGAQGVATQMAGGSFQSDLKGPVGAVTIAGNVNGALLNVFGGTNATLASVTIGGSIIGGPDSGAGGIVSVGPMGPVKVAHDLVGGLGTGSGYIACSSLLKSVTVGGSIIGGIGGDSGHIQGFMDVGTIKIGGDLIGGAGGSSGRVLSGGTLKSLTIGGSLRGGTADSTGMILSTGNVTSIQIKGDLIGGDSNTTNINITGGIEGMADIATLTIGGSIHSGGAHNGTVLTASGTVAAVSFSKKITIGGSIIQDTAQGNNGSNNSGGIAAQNDMASITIKHNVLGGFIAAGGKIGSVTLGGSLVGADLTSGGTYDGSGIIVSGGEMTTVKVGGDIVGGTVTNGTTLNRAGYIGAGRIGSVTVAGSIYSGDATGAASVRFSGAISATNDIGSVTVKGGLIGNSSMPVNISARGQLTPPATSDVAIGKITIGGQVLWANLFAGNDVNGDAQIGTVSIGGNWTASNLVAGARNLGADDTVGGTGANRDYLNFGDSHDVSLGAGRAGIVGSIASITIKGRVLGADAPVGSASSFGFVAEHIGALKVAGKLVTLPTDHTPLPIAISGLVSVHLL